MAYIHSIKRNLISVLILDRLGYSFLFKLEKLNYTKIHYWLALEYFMRIFKE